jgi:hypothetical protein
MQNLEQQLDSFDPQERRAALVVIYKNEVGEILSSPVGNFVNIHIHTFYGYNAYGYSPSKAAFLASKHRLAVAGIIDFDVLDGLDEFLNAAKLTGVKACVGMETRVFVNEYADKEINSPGEPGIAYHIGIGFPCAPRKEHLCKYLKELKATSQRRNIELTNRVNKFLAPVILDYDKDVLPLTPGANPTERHLCQAYAIKAANMFKDKKKLIDFWADKLGCPAESLDIPCGSKLLGEIRKKTMKKGSVGYVVPDKGSFPAMAEVNKFIIEAGGIPTLCWHDGISEGEMEEEKLIAVAMSSGVRAFSVIPNPVYTPRDPKKKLENLYKVIELVDKIGLPVVSGTEMNNYGQAFVDDFESKELSPLVPVFLKGALIIYAHSVMQRQADMGYMSKWAEQTFKDVAEKNRFFEKLGKILNPQNEHKLSGLLSNSKPQDVLSVLETK